MPGERRRKKFGGPENVIFHTKGGLSRKLVQGSKGER
jgi:hypothetical protein